MDKNDKGGLPRPPSTDQIDYTAAISKIKQICFEAAGGNLNVRFSNRNAHGEEFSQVYSAINQLLDQVDAFVRESGAALEHAAEGKLYRNFIERGMLGDFKMGAAVINSARESMAASNISRKDEMVAIADNLEEEVKKAVDIVRASSETMRNESDLMSVNLEDVTEQARNIVDLSNNATHNVESSAAAVEEMSASAQEIHRQSNSSCDAAVRAAAEIRRTDEIVKSLTVAASEIGEIANMIKDIASRTNLLALNATIEAARAGDAGKGFAVVASEVKNLAGQTSEATSQVDVQISTIQEITEKTTRAVAGIGVAIHETSEISRAVASTAKEQLAAIQEISKNVQEAAQATRKSSSSLIDVAEKAGNSSLAARQVANESRNTFEASDSLSTKFNDIMGNLRRYEAFDRRQRERYEVSAEFECRTDWNKETRLGHVKNVSRDGAAINISGTTIPDQVSDDFSGNDFSGNDFSFTPKGWARSLCATIIDSRDETLHIRFDKGQGELVSELIKAIAA